MSSPDVYQSSLSLTLFIYAWLSAFMLVAMMMVRMSHIIFFLWSKYTQKSHTELNNWQWSVMCHAQKKDESYNSLNEKRKTLGMYVYLHWKCRILKSSSSSNNFVKSSCYNFLLLFVQSVASREFQCNHIGRRWINSNWKRKWRRYTKKYLFSSKVRSIQDNTK